MNTVEAKARALKNLERKAVFEAAALHILGDEDPKTKRAVRAVDSAWRRVVSEFKVPVNEAGSIVLKAGQQAGRIMRERGISL